MKPIGLTLLAVGAFVVAVNLYTSFLRYPFHVVRGGTRASYRFVSGVGGVGSVLLLNAVLFLRPSRLTWAAATLFLIDTGGLLWFAVALWWSRGSRQPGGREK